MIRIEGKNIVINGNKTLIYGGELHYFRVPQKEWRNRIKQLKEAGLNLVSTYVPWKFHEMEEGSIDLTGKTRPERDLKTFLEIVKEEGMYCLVRPGPYVMAEIIDHGVPSWFIDNYPEAVAKTREGAIHPTRVVSYMHPLFLEKVKKWYAHVCNIVKAYQITNGGPVIFFQLDNEVGMFHWVTNTPDFNPETIKLFKQYLLDQFPDKTDFERTFQFPTEQLSTSLEQLVKRPEKENAYPLRNEFSLFLRKHYRAFIEYLKKLADNFGIQVPYVVNIHGFHTIDLLKRGTMYPIGISQLLEVAKIENVLMAGDYYIGNIEYDNYIDIVLANAFTKSVQWSEQPLFSAEFQGGSIHDKPRLQPTTFDLTTRLCVADGMNGINYYMFVSGENYENIGIHGKRHEWQAPLGIKGEKRPHYSVIQHLGSMFQVFEEELVDTIPEVDTYLGFYPDYFMTDFYDEYTKEMIDSIQHEREAYLFNGIAKGLRSNNYIFDAYNLLNEEELDPLQIPTLWVFSTKWMDENIQMKLMNYLEAGGNLILFPKIPEKDMKNRPCTLLKDYLGIQVKGVKHGGFATVGAIENVSIYQAEIYDQTDGAFAWIEENNRDVIAFEKEIGTGKVIVFGVGLELDFEYKREIIEELAKAAGIHKRLERDDELDITVRNHPSGREFFFLNNFDEYEKTSAIVYKGETLFHGKSLKIPAKTGLMLPRNVHIHDDLLVEMATGEIFEVIVEADKLTLTVKIVQEEEEFVIASSRWIPHSENNEIQVETLDSNRYKIRICSVKKIEQIQWFAK
ncbi:beta-galactosidase [Caldibacillus lycopersici]|uniref:Beta-galactosidase n=1 Tax=Perspicuibacillus lycopersici TaxID=1325689 RepID=A0AAE3IQH0_9BACI|nr:beta-galactosidase [Perspicuibacillus lycopersici]MCU9612683.1 beta-galactosidase [Perspicuibacillus lycopersici]